MILYKRLYKIEPYAWIYVELIILIGSIPVFTTIFDHYNFKYVGIGSTILTIFVLIPYFSYVSNQTTFEERQTLLEEKDKRIMELTEHKENMSMFC